MWFVILDVAGKKWVISDIFREYVRPSGMALVVRCRRRCCMEEIVPGTQVDPVPILSSFTFIEFVGGPVFGIVGPK